MRPESEISNPGRVAFVCVDPGVPVFGCKGSSVHVQEVIRALLRRGARVDLFTCRRGGDAPRGLEEVRVHELPSPVGETLAEREIRARQLDRELVEALRRDSPFDLVYQRYSLWSDGGMGFSREAGIPGVLEVNAPLIREQARHRGLVDREGAEAVAARAFRAATLVTCVSPAVADWVRSLADDAGQVQVIPNGVDPDRFQPRPPPARPAPAALFTVGFVGTLKSWHGLPVLLEAFRRLVYGGDDAPVAARLLLVGDGPERSTLEGSAREAGLGAVVHFTGAVPPTEVPSLLASMDVGVAPYPAPGAEDFYFSPLKIMEYLAAGLPTVASRVGEVDALIDDGVHGLLCPPGDPAALAQALRRLALNPSLARRLGEAGRSRIGPLQSWDGVVGRVLAAVHAPPGSGER